MIGAIVNSSIDITLEATSALLGVGEGVWVETAIKTLPGLESKVAWAKLLNLTIPIGRCPCLRFLALVLDFGDKPAVFLFSGRGHEFRAFWGAESGDAKSQILKILLCSAKALRKMALLNRTRGKWEMPPLYLS